MVVHLYGIPANLDKIVALCKKYNVPLIEDAAESLGSRYKGKHTGTFGKFGILSFNGNKIITTSSGGMVISEDKEAIEKMRFWASQARDKARHYQHSELGYNYRMSNVSAAIGRGQLKVLDQRLKRRREIFNLYKSGFSKNRHIKLMPTNSKDSFSNCWLSSITLSDSNKVIPLIEQLEKFNIETRPLWKPMHLQPFYQEFKFFGNKTSDRLFIQGLCLPSDSKLLDEDIRFVISKVNEFFSL
jgi:dTDP-4-amino-4,6-dideoxygalactose transaminase